MLEQQEKGSGFPELGSTERLHSAAKLAVIAEALISRGASAADALKGTGVAPGDLHSHKLLVSQEQLLTACGNALRLSGDRHLPYRIGNAIHVSAYGMYGYAILCCTSFRQAMAFATRYHLLAAPLAAISFAEQDDRSSWTLEAIHHRKIDSRIARFVIELQIGIHTSLHRDVMGPTFVPREITLAYDRSDDFHLSEDLVGCPVRWGQDANRLLFDTAALDAEPKLGNRTTYSAIIDVCDALLADMATYGGVAGRIRRLLVESIHRPPTLEAVADRLGMTARTIRRQLGEHGTSFRALLDEARSELAIKYLRETRMTNEDIAAALGFADPANFRRAFRRWTGTNPNGFRAL